MRFSNQAPKATNTHSEYVIVIASPLQKWLHEFPRCYVIPTLLVLFYFEITEEGAA